jgi:Arc/MetJ family transcription regulator
MERFQRALDEASVRLTGKCFDRISGDYAAVDLVLNDLGQSFVRELGDSDLETLST